MNHKNNKVDPKIMKVTNSLSAAAEREGATTFEVAAAAGVLLALAIAGSSKDVEVCLANLESINLFIAEMVKNMCDDAMSDDMVERVARALCEECAMEPFDELSRSKYIGDARVVIAAMREPTPEMVAVAELNDYTEGNGLTDKVTADIARDLWRDMIDVLLRQSK